MWWRTRSAHSLRCLCGEVNEVSSNPIKTQRNIDTTLLLQFGVYIERMKETHTITTTHEVPADIREALKIREDLDGIEGTLAVHPKSPGDTKYVTYNLFMFLVTWLVFIVRGVFVGGTRLQFQIGNSAFSMGNSQFGFWDVARVERCTTFDHLSQRMVANGFCLETKDGTPHIWRFAIGGHRSAEWFYQEIRQRLDAAHSGTVPEALIRLTRQAGETESSTGPALASFTKEMT